MANAKARKYRLKDKNSSEPTLPLVAEYYRDYSLAFWL